MCVTTNNHHASAQGKHANPCDSSKPDPKLLGSKRARDSCETVPIEPGAGLITTTPVMKRRKLAPLRGTVGVHSKPRSRLTATEAHQKMDDLQRSAKVARARASNAQASLKAKLNDMVKEIHKTQHVIDNNIIPELIEARQAVRHARAEFTSVRQQKADFSSQPDVEAALSKCARADEDLHDLEWKMSAFQNHVSLVRQQDNSKLEKEVAILADAATTAEEEAARHALGVRRRFGKKRSTKILTLWAVADCLEGGV